MNGKERGTPSEKNNGKKKHKRTHTLLKLMKHAENILMVECTFTSVKQKPLPISHNFDFRSLQGNSE